MTMYGGSWVMGVLPTISLANPATYGVPGMGRISDPAQIRRVPLGVAAFSKRRFEKKTGEAAHFAAKSRARPYH